MIYLFNQLEELIDVIDEVSLAEFTHTIELNQFDRSSFEIPVDYKPEIIKEAQFFGFQSRDRDFCLFRISEKSYDIGLTIEGIDRAASDLHSFIIEDKRPGGSADQVLSEILEDTGYQLGNVDGLTRTGRLSFYYISVRQALVKIIESYACEFKVRYTFVENKIIGRYIDLNQRFGRITGHQFEYGSNILNVTYEESSDDVVTALIGRGKGEESTNDSGEATGGYGRRIQFKDVSWSVSRGDPVNKPAGQNYVSNEAARNIYGLHQNGVIKHRFGVYTNEDIEDPVELLKATYKELQRLSVPIVTFKANLLDLSNAIEQDIWIGDSVAIVRDQIGIAFEARIHKLVIDKLNENRSVVELGDYQTLQSKDRSTRQQALKDAIGGLSESSIRQAIVAEVGRRDKEFDEKIRVKTLEFDNSMKLARSKAEEVKQELSDTINQRFDSFDNGPLKEAKRKAEEALKNAGASTLLAQEAKQIGSDSIAKLEAFKSQATSAQTALSGDLDALKRTIANDIRPKQAQAEAEIAKQVEALNKTKNELAGVKSAQATYEETTTRRLAELTNLANGKASKSELTQTAEELASRIASVRVGGRNYYRDSEKVRTSTRFFSFPLHPYFTQENVGEIWTLSFDLKINEGGEIRPLHFYHYQTNRFGLKASADITPNKEWQRFTFTGPVIFPNDDPRYSRGEMALYDYAGNNNYSVRRIKLEKGTLATDWSPAPEDTDGLITEAKATFERTAQGLRTDLSAIQEYVNKDGQRQEALQRYTREESAKQATAVRELLTKDYVGKATYQEDVKGINQRIEAVKTSTNKDIASQIASYRQSVDGKFTDISSQITTYKQDLGGQISGLSNRLTSSEQGTTTQISNLSNRINSNKQGTDNQISNLKTQIATNKDNAEQQMGRISDQVSANKANADSQFANVSNQLARKVETTDFQRVKETSQLYERILGNTENGIVDKVARMAMTNQLFQVEVSKNENLKTVQRQLAGSWGVHNKNSVNEIIAGFNLAGRNAGIKAETIRLEGNTLADKLTAIDGYFKRLFVGEGTFATLNTDILRANSITAEKIVIDMAFFDKLVANEAYLSKLFAKQAFINYLNSITIDADRITGGNLSATNGAMKIDLNKGQYEVYTEKAALKRVVAGYPNQFIKFDTGIQDVTGNREIKSGVTVIGSNSDGTENGNNQTFAGIQIWNNPQQRNVNSVGDFLKVSNKGYGLDEKGWMIQTIDTPSISPIVDKNKPETGKRSVIYSGDFYFINKWGQKVSLLGILERFIVNFNTIKDKRGILYTDFSELN